jgi:hypothetical protein
LPVNWVYGSNRTYIEREGKVLQKKSSEERAPYESKNGRLLQIIKSNPPARTSKFSSHSLPTDIKMKSITIAALFAGSVAAFAPATVSQRSQTSLNAFVAEDLPGVLAPAGFFDPAGFGAKADEATLKRYREAELTHGRVAMLASLGFLVGEGLSREAHSFSTRRSLDQLSHIFLKCPPHFGWFLLPLSVLLNNSVPSEDGLTPLTFQWTSLVFRNLVTHLVTLDSTL